MTPPHLKPGKLAGVQRDMILSASHFHRGDPIPFNTMQIPYQGRAHYNGLISRGFLEERKPSFAYLTEKGWWAARAMFALEDMAWRVAEIDAHLERIGVLPSSEPALAKATPVRAGRDEREGL